MQKFYTVGMAGHIDHGKTTLTKALTGVETDRLKEEKLRNISIEPGFAPLVQSKDLQISIIDVPGHERFIRQMIAGVAGIDFVVLVVAGDEGVMPQTREHLSILSLLGVERGMIVITKIDYAEADLLDLIQLDIKETIKETFLENAPINFVDSISQRGISQLKDDLIHLVSKGKKRQTNNAFRLPIDHVFTVKGQGVVVRGTVFDGLVRIGDEVIVLPRNIRARVRNIESHYEQKDAVFAGQRAAINMSGVSHNELKRGDVLVKDDFYMQTSRIDISFTPLENINTIKQRQQIKLYVGTSEVTGKIIFFDRNELQKNDLSEILCQLQLDEEVVVTRGDRLIIRRATPVETIGGGWIIEPNAKKYRFGENTIAYLQQVKDGSAKERVMSLLKREFAHTADNIKRLASVTDEQFMQIKEQLIAIDKHLYTNDSIICDVMIEMKKLLSRYHEAYPLRQGLNRAELLSELTVTFPSPVIEYTLMTKEADELIKVTEQTVALRTFTPTLPKKWEKKMKRAIIEWERQGAETDKIIDIFTRHDIKKTLHNDLYYYLLQSNRAYEFDEGRLIARSAVKQLKDILYRQTKEEAFSLQVARNILGLSRKNLVPLLELFDRLNYTKRIENKRVWIL